MWQSITTPFIPFSDVILRYEKFVFASSREIQVKRSFLNMLKVLNKNIGISYSLDVNDYEEFLPLATISE